MTHPCRICKSEYRAEIEALLLRKVSRQAVCEKYHQLFNTSVSNMYASLSIHVKKKHPPTIQDRSPLVKGTKAATDFNDYAQRLLDMGITPELMNPGKISHSNIIAAKRTQIEEAKVKNQSDATKLMFLKFFRGEAEPIEGEVIDDTKQIGGENLQTDTN